MKQKSLSLYSASSTRILSALQPIPCDTNTFAEAPRVPRGNLPSYVLWQSTGSDRHFNEGGASHLRAMEYELPLGGIEI